MMGLAVGSCGLLRASRSRIVAPDILDSLDASTPFPVRVRARLHVSTKDALTIYLQKHLDHSSHSSSLSSESELDSSKQDEDERGYADDSMSAEPEEWHGVQDTTGTFDSADRDGESEPAQSSDSRPLPVLSPSGTPRPSLRYTYLAQLHSRGFTLYPASSQRETFRI